MFNEFWRRLNPLSALGMAIFSTALCLFDASPAGAAAPLCSAVFTESSQPATAIDLAGQIRQGDLFSSPEFYNSYGDPEVARKIIKKWYRYYSKALIQSFEDALPPRFLVLLIDPGIATRVPDFLSFAQKILQQNANISAQDLRSLFAQSLGTEQVFRGLMLNPDEAANIQKNGMESRGLQNPEVDFRLQSEFNGDVVSDGLPNLIRQGFVGEVESRLKGRFLAESMLLSVSKWIEVTSATAWSSKGVALSPGKYFYLFEIQIPKISLLRLDGPFKQLNSSVGSWRYFETKSAFSEDTFRRDVLDPDFEMFIFGKISSSAIVQVHKYEQRPQPWRPAQ